VIVVVNHSITKSLNDSIAESFVVKQFCISSLEREKPRKSTALPLDIARSMVVLLFNGISGTRGQFRDIEKECIAEPCFFGA
jgi:hypothetical protein